MIWVALGALLLGVFYGRFVLSPELIAVIDGLSDFALKLLVFSVGMEVGSDKAAFDHVRRVGWRVLLIPAGVAAGSVGAGLLAGFCMGLPLNLSGALAAGMGWSSLSAPLLGELAGVQAGTMAFVCNLLRELLAFALIPLVARRLGYVAAIAPGGATTMDTTLPAVTRYTDDATAMLALVSGVVCSALVPLLLPLLYNLL